MGLVELVPLSFLIPVICVSSLFLFFFVLTLTSLDFNGRAPATWKHLTKPLSGVGRGRELELRGSNLREGLMASLGRGCMTVGSPLAQVVGHEHAPGPAQDGVLGSIIGVLLGRDLQYRWNEALVGIECMPHLSAMYWLMRMMPMSS